MPKFNVDLRFTIIVLETYAARRHAEVGLRRLETSGEDIRTMVFDELKASGFKDDEDSRSIAYQEIYFLEDELPRLQAYGIHFVLFSTFESVVKRLPAYVGNWTAADVTATGGTGFITQAMRFYGTTLGIQLFSDKRQENAVRLAADVRHAIAHATGRLSILKPRLRDRLDQALGVTPGLVAADGFLNPEPEYIRSAAQTFDTTAHELVERLKAAY